MATRKETISEAKAIIANGGRIDKHLTKALLDIAVEERGADYVYTTPSGERATCDQFGSPTLTCVNVFVDEETGDRTPGCIVGLVASYLYEIDKIPALGSARTLNDRLGLPFDYSADDLLIQAQSEQDKGRPWGRAVETAWIRVNG